MYSPKKSCKPSGPELENPPGPTLSNRYSALSNDLQNSSSYVTANSLVTNLKCKQPKKQQKQYIRTISPLKAHHNKGRPVHLKPNKNCAANINTSEAIPVLKRRKKVYIFSDSHGKDLGNLLLPILPNDYESFACANSGASVDYILNNISNMTQEFSNEDTVIVIAGANNICDVTYSNREPARCILRKFKEFVAANQHTNLVFVTQFQRHDLTSDCVINKEIYKTNCELKQLDSLHLINVSDFNRHLFTRHGQHLNKFGKRVLSRRIADFVLNKNHYSSHPPQILTSSVRIMEVDMGSAIDTYKNSDVAFAHCISADFGHAKNMSEGVATIFKEKFGKPCATDLCDKNLTFQKSKSGAGVYGLVTKPQYFMNSNNFYNYDRIYDAAFNQMTRHFKQGKFKTLICSPMGCVRDCIRPSHFISNITNFVNSTGASVVIVTSNDTSRSRLRNGVSPAKFVERMKQLIGLDNKATSQPSSPHPESSTIDLCSTMFDPETQSAADTPHELPLHLTPDINLSVISDTSPWRGWSTPEQRPVTYTLHGQPQKDEICLTSTSPVSSQSHQQPVLAPGHLQYSEAVKCVSSEVEKQSNRASEKCSLNVNSSHVNSSFDVNSIISNSILMNDQICNPDVAQLLSNGLNSLNCNLSKKLPNT